MRVWRVILCTQDVQVSGDSAPFAGIQHVAFVVAPDAASIPRVIREDRVLAKAGLDAGWVPRVMEELDTSRPLWCAKLGPDPDDASIFVCVNASTQEEVPVQIALLNAQNSGVLEMLATGWVRVAPTPIDTSKTGVW